MNKSRRFDKPKPKNQHNLPVRSTKIRKVFEEYMAKCLADVQTNETFVDDEAIPLESLPVLPECEQLDYFLQLKIPKKIAFNLSKLPRVNYHSEFQMCPMQIFVTKIHSPFKFWFVHVDDATKLKTLTDSMQEFYSENESDDPYKVTFPQAIEGRPCAALYNYSWYRAVVIQAINEFKVTVMFFDYGTIATIPMADIRYLLQEFLSVKYLIMRGRLALVAPKETYWPSDPEKGVTKAFYDLVDDKQIKATMYAYEKDDEIYHLVLHDALIPEKQISINQKLADDDQCQLVTSKTEQWPHVAELYPTFKMLEMNRFTTYYKLLKLEEPPSSEESAAYHTEEYQEEKRKQRTLYGFHSEDAFFKRGSIQKENKVKSVDVGSVSTV